MNSATPAFFALLLICSLPAVALVAADSGGLDGEPTEDRQQTLQQAQLQTQPQQQAQDQSQSAPTAVNNTTNRLELTGEIRNEHAEYDPGLAMELARTDDELRIDADQYVLVDREFDGATADERAEMIDDARAQLKERSDELERREREIVREHNRGERSNAELLEVLIRNSHQADTIYDTFDHVHDRADGVPGYSITNQERRADKVVSELHQTPIRENLVAAAQTPTDTYSHQVQIRTAETGYSLAMIDGDTVLIETKRFDNRDTDSPDRFQDELTLFDQAQRFYPWAADEAGNNWGRQSYTLTQLYRVEYDFGTNHVQIYLDGGTGDVYREYQELTLSELSVEEQREWTKGGLDVTLNETPSDGPVEITVLEASSGDPQSATITVNGDEIGKTDGQDGTLWYVPPTEEYELEIETSTRHISSTIEENEIETEDRA